MIRDDIVRNLAVVSGGMDSVTMLYEYEAMISHVLTFHYGSKHNDREIGHAAYHARALGKHHLIIDLGFIGQNFKSDLLKSGGEIPEGHYEDPTMKRTVVPFRNGIMLSVACGYAESVGCKNVMIGAHAGDRAIYPDCRAAFLSSMSMAMKEGTYEQVGLFAPYVRSSKREIALRGQKARVDWRETWSCYKGQDRHCGKCGTCVERKEALQGFDTTDYEA